MSAVDIQVFQLKILTLVQLCGRDFNHFLSNGHNFEDAALATERAP
jgi:hypothetical protein